MDTEDAECANNGRKRNHFIQKVYPSNFPGITYAHAEFKWFCVNLNFKEFLCLLNKLNGRLTTRAERIELIL